jgi:polyribonucleotide nucleotidyltransferase
LLAKCASNALCVIYSFTGFPNWLPKFSSIQVGNLVSGTVRRIEPFGVFMGISNTRVSGLLQISNVSRQHIESVQVGAGAVEVGPRLFLIHPLVFHLSREFCFLAGRVYLKLVKR